MNTQPYKGRKEEYNRALLLRKKGLGYVSIAKILKLSPSTIRNWTQKIKVDWFIAYRKGVKRKLVDIDKLKSKDAVRVRLIKERGRKCEECKLTEWFSKPITLETEHIDGNNKNNKKNNLKLLCPNCHSYTDTWRRKKSLNAKIGKQDRLKNE